MRRRGLGQGSYTFRVYAWMAGFFLLALPLGWAQDEGQASRSSAEGERLPLVEHCEGDLLSCLMFGAMYADGEAIVKDESQAIMLHYEACISGSLTGCTYLGWRYRDGDRVLQDEAQATFLFELACRGGDLLGCHSLDAMTEEEPPPPPPVEQEEEEEEEPKEPASVGAPLTSTPGCSGCSCQGMMQMGDEGASGESIAFQQDHKACWENDYRSCFNLGLRFLNGSGVVADNGQAIEMFGKACEGGESQACSGLGTMFDLGQGVGENDAQAVELYEKACDGGDMFGCHSAGAKYDLGEGVMQDDGRAAELYRHACNGGRSASCYDLGLKFASGKGVPQNEVQAVALFQQACNAGEDEACEVTEVGQLKLESGVSKRDVSKSIGQLFGFVWNNDSNKQRSWFNQLGILGIAALVWFKIYRGWAKREK